MFQKTLKTLKLSIGTGIITAAYSYTAHSYIAMEQSVSKAAALAYDTAITSFAEAQGFERKEAPMEDLSYAEMAELEAALVGINPSLVRAVMHVESGKNSYALSNKGAIGLMQIMPFNAKRCGFPDPGHLLKPRNNIKCGVQILKEELDRYNWNTIPALQSYNGGPKCVGKCSESINYSKSVLARQKQDRLS